MNGKILFVHDENSRNDSVAAALRHYCDVTVSSGVREAIRLLRSEVNFAEHRCSFNLIISPVHLDTQEGLTVFDLLTWAKRDPVIRQVPFLLLELEPDDVATCIYGGVQAAAISLGASGCLSLNQFDEHQLMNTITRYLPVCD